MSTVVMLPKAKPAMPKIAVCASETMPPYEARKMRLIATMPKISTCVSNWSTV